MSNAAKVMDWNGHDVPVALAALPPGQYVIEPIVPLANWNLTPIQVAELEAAIDDTEAGVPWETVDAELRQLITDVAKRKTPETDDQP